MCFIAKFVSKFVEYGRITDNKRANCGGDGAL